MSAEPQDPRADGQPDPQEWASELAIRDQLLSELAAGGTGAKGSDTDAGAFQPVAPTRSARRAARAGGAKPITFSATLVRAILAGNKTETRRPMRPQPPSVIRAGGKDRPADEHGQWLTCPLAQVGQMLWIREPWAPADSGSGYRYLADLGPCAGRKLKWKSGRFMPERAARIQLGVTHVFPQRLATMTEAHALREGAPVSLDAEVDPLAWFRRAWDGLYAADGLGFDDKPWVWVIRFRLYTINGVLVE